MLDLTCRWTYPPPPGVLNKEWGGGARVLVIFEKDYTSTDIPAKHNFSYCTLWQQVHVTKLQRKQVTIVVTTTYKSKITGSC